MNIPKFITDSETVILSPSEFGVSVTVKTQSPVNDPQEHYWSTTTVYSSDMTMGYVLRHAVERHYSEMGRILASRWPAYRTGS